MTEKARLALLAGLLGATALGGCTVGPDFKRPGWAFARVLVRRAEGGGEAAGPASR